MAVLAALAAVLGLSASAYAAPSAASEPATVVVLPVEHGGNLKPHYATRLSGRLVQGLSRSSSTVISADAMPDPPCDAPACWATFAQEHEGDFVVQTTVSVTERDYDLVVVLLDGENGETVARREQRCELCGLGEVEEVVADQAAALQTRIELLSVPPPRIVITTDPPGATVFVDGKAVGVTPLQHEVKEGRHLVKVELEGHAEELESAIVQPGADAKLSFALDPVADAVPPDRNKKRRKAGWALLGVGVASMAAGGVLIGVDEQPNRLQCRGDNIDADGDCRLRMNTLWPGVGVLAAGTVLAVTGLGLALSRRKKGADHERAAALVISPNMLSVRGAF